MRSLVVSPGGSVLSEGQYQASNSSSEEFISLCEALSSLLVVKDIVLNVRQIKAATFFGSGNIALLKSLVTSNNISLVLVDVNLSPIQQRNLEHEFKAKVIDRTGLILEIFGNRAKTREGALQVELAHLEYQKSRLVRSWTHLERQRGGIGFMGGPGETQIESDRRILAEKISKIKRSLDKVILTRHLHRENRKNNRIPVISLVGYTNAGKSSIFNFLTNANVLSQDMLFATLDPTMRAFKLLGKKEVILSDTVGFISKLPTGLISAFKATLEEVINADLILHVIDISHSESKFQALEVEKVIDELDWEGKTRPPILEIYNKIDKLKKSQLEQLRVGCSNSQEPILLSALSGSGFQYLENKLRKLLELTTRTETIFLSFKQTKKRAWLFEKNIVSNELVLNHGFSLTVDWSKEQKSIFRKISST